MNTPSMYTMYSYDAPMQVEALTPRQDRLEAAIASALRNQSTRSELRSNVIQLVDLFRLQGVPPEEGVMRVRSMAVRATIALVGSDLAAGDAAAERVSMVERWAIERYRRVD